MINLIQSLENIIQKNNWPHTKIDSHIFGIQIIGEDHQWMSYARCLPDGFRFLFYSICPAKASEEKRQVIMELLTRINFDLVGGNFELNLENGEIRCKTSVHFQGECDYEGMIERAIYGNVFTMNFYLPGIMKLLYGDYSVAVILEEIEKGNVSVV